jgi:hypothetical protein
VKFLILQRIVLVICLFFICGFNNLALTQAYNTSLGLRAGTDIGISVVQRVAKRVTLEGLYRDAVLDDNRNIDLIVKRHSNMITRRLNIYTGIGFGHLAKLDDDRVVVDRAFTVPMIVGAEVVFTNLHIGFDIQPSLVLGEVSGRRVIPSTALSVRYIIVKRKNKKLNNLFDNIKSKFNKNEKKKN